MVGGPSTDEIFESLDGIVQEWKVKLEWIVAEALRKMRRTTREKRNMMKYIPGEATGSGSWHVAEAKAAILAEWRHEVNRTIGTTQTKLRDLAQDTVRQTAQQALSGSRGGGGGALVAPRMRSLDLAVLLQDLEALFKANSGSADKLSKIPIYQAMGRKNCYGVRQQLPSQMANNYSLWQPAAGPVILDLLSTVMRRQPTAVMGPQSEQEILDILRDFTVDQRDRKTIEAEWSAMEEKKTRAKVVVDRQKKEAKDQRRVNSSAQRMLARKEERRKAGDRPSYQLKEYKASNGEAHFIVVRTKGEESDVTAKTTAKNIEDFFADWRVNLQRRRAQRRPRHRKLSHRAERRQIIQSAATTPTAPLSYAEALQRNLKIRQIEQPSVEEIFSSFNSFLDEELKKPVSPTPAPLPDILDMADIFFPFRHNFHVPRPQPEDVDILATAAMLPFTAAAVVPPFDCGRPTVLSARPIAKAPITTAAATAAPAAAAAGQEGFRKRRQLSQKQLAAAKEFKMKKRLQRHSTKQQLAQLPKQQLTKQQPQPPQQQQLRPKLTTAAVPRWQHQLPSQPLPQQQRRPVAEIDNFAVELAFGEWIHNLREPAIRPLKSFCIVNSGYEPAYFLDWCHNLELKEKVVVITPPASPEAGRVSPKGVGSARGQKRRLKEQEKKEEEEENKGESSKDGRREDYAKNVKIRDKKRTDVQRRSGKKTSAY